MSTANLTIEFDDATGQVAVNLTGDGEARKVAEDIMKIASEIQGENFIGVAEPALQ